MPKIDEIYAYIAADKNEDDEGLMGMLMGKTWVPLVGADTKRMKSLKPIAKLISEKTGKKAVLAHFTKREDEPLE